MPRESEINRVTLLPTHLPDYEEGLRTLIKRVNGVIYMGERIEAIISTIHALRDDPELTRLLLDTPSTVVGSTGEPDTDPKRR